MNRKAFRQLLKNYLDDSCSEEERLIVEKWYELLGTNSPSLSLEELNEVEIRLWEKIHSSTINVENARQGKRSRIKPWRVVAAACFTGILVMLGVLWFYNQKQPATTSSPLSVNTYEGILSETNDGEKPKTIELEDGSSVVLYSGSKLTFPKHFTYTKREVYLEGNAFFIVSKNPGRPFFVYVNQIVTQVLGTSFLVNGKQGQVEVAVKTGKVAVYENQEQIKLNEAEQKSNGVIVTPNQKVTYFQDERHFVTSIVDKPIPVERDSSIALAATDFNYNETPLYKVLEDLENCYELEIVLEKEKIKNCLFTGDLTDENLFNKLEGICLSFNATYEVKGTKILLKGGKECAIN